MARTGVQFSDIEKAALKVQGLGKTPTVDRVRETLGTGSRSTIGKYLKEWREAQIQNNSALPDELTTLVGGLWQKLHDGADRRVEDANEKHKLQKIELDTIIRELKKESTKLKIELQKKNDTLIAEQKESSKLKKTLNNYEKELLKLQTSSAAAKEQLEASTAENTRLHKLAVNIQSNLEHYQEQTQAQLAELNLQTQSEKMQLSQEINTRRQEQAQAKAQLARQQQKNEDLELRLLIQNTQHKEAEEERIKMQQQLQTTNEEKAIFTERYNNATKENKRLHNKLTNIDKSILEYEKELAIAGNYAKRLQKELKLQENKTTSLLAEKSRLAQKKPHKADSLRQREEKTLA